MKCVAVGSQNFNGITFNEICISWETTLMDFFWKFIGLSPDLHEVRDAEAVQDRKIDQKIWNWIF